MAGEFGNPEVVEEEVDILLIGGGMAFTFFKAKRYEIGKSLLDEEKVVDKSAQDEVDDQMVVLDEIVNSLSKTISDLKTVKESEANNLLTEILVRLPDEGLDFREATRSFEVGLIKKALDLTNGNQTKAAKLLKGLRLSC